MNISIQSVHFDADKKLLDFIESKLQKIKKLWDDVIGSEVILRLDKNDTAENKIVEIRLIIPGNDLFAKKQSKSFEAATDNVIEALRRQVEKTKEKIRGV